MTNNTISQEAAKLKEIILSYETNKKNVQAEIEKIDEKYRLLAEAEKAALTDAVAFYDNAISALSLIAEKAPANNTEVENEVKTETKDESEEKVVDSLFPENNLPDEVNESSEEETVVAVEEEKELDLGNMNQDDTVLDFEKEDVPEETEEETKEEEDEEGLSDEDWNEVSQW